MIEIKNLYKTFHTKAGDVDALKNINLTINDGDIYGIIGMSGAGKSTLVRCINMLERPTGGQVIIDGKNMELLSDKELREARRDITMIFQSFNLLMQRNCLKNVCFPMELAGVKKAEAEKRAMELLELVGLPDKAKAYPAQLSGGQQQRVAIARALATNPKVLLCDEATSALDPNTTHSILSLIRDINKKLGITVVIITHQMSVVEEVCTHVAILDRGEVAEVGTVGAVFSSPKSNAGRRLVFPNGEDDMVSDPTKEKRLRVVFNGAETAGAPLITTMAIETGIAVNILAASIRSIESRAYGSMLLGIPGKRENIFTVTDYLAAVPDVYVEEV
ncbi:MAG: ATP-binding cassette domain-containing protein [Oscillospiraceae bacterium]|nr:ATP-binding cassette domain-containing protein [Oscillospiraceae bacterium]